jgi:hypothetical protein
VVFWEIEVDQCIGVGKSYGWLCLIDDSLADNWRLVGADRSIIDSSCIRTEDYRICGISC